MAKVSGASNIAPRSRGGPGFADPQALQGLLRVITGTVANAADDSDGSKYYLCDLPSDCYLDPGTAFRAKSLGYATLNIGTETDATALVTIAKTGNDTVSPIAFADANHGKELWEVLGLSANPGGFIALYLHASAGATGAGSMAFTVKYIHRS